MFAEAWQLLLQWNQIDSWIAGTAALAAMACAVPGCFLVVRRQSMMGDAISHCALPGIVLAFLLAHWMQQAGWLSDTVYETWRHAILFVGAIVLGVVCAVATELVQKLGRMEASAALGVVFTSLFALGLLLMCLFAHEVHIDPDCVLFGSLENVAMSSAAIPAPAMTNGLALVLNLLVIGLLFKELRISAFDPGLASSMGIPARGMHYLLMSLTAVTLVAAFESVGSILVIAMLIVPPATAYLLTDRLWPMLWVSLLLAAASAFLGHAAALTLPSIVFSRLGFPGIRSASTAGMVATVAGLLFALAVFFSPRYGLFTRMAHVALLARRVVVEDVLGVLYRLEEREAAPVNASTAASIQMVLGMSRWRLALALWQLRLRKLIDRTAAGWQLTAAGRATAQHLVRSHRLWESFLAHHFPAVESHLHESASRVEHFIDDRLQKQLADDLDSPERDPHGTVIPGKE
jgi:manganese/zinc/iron transport system permease protein